MYEVVEHWKQYQKQKQKEIALKEMDKYFTEFYQDDVFDWTWKRGKEELKGYNKLKKSE